MAKVINGGVIRDDETLTHSEIALRIGRADRWAKEFIRANVSCVDAGNGLLLVSGRLWRLAIEQMSDRREIEAGAK